MNNPSSLQTDALSVLNTLPGCHLFLLPDAPRFTIAGATDAYLAATYLVREEAIDRGVFETLTDNQNYTEATGVKNLQTSLNYVLENKKRDRMAEQRYDVLNPRTGSFEFRVWSPFNKPVLDEHGNVRYIIHTVEDITEKVLLQKEKADKEEQLNVSESRFRQMVEQAPIPILLSRGNDVITENLNEPMLSFMNKTSVHEVLGKPMVEVFPELKEQEALKIVQNVQKTGIPFKGEELPVDLFINDQLERFYYNISYTPLIESGEVTGVLHMAIDISSQVAARRKIEENQADLQRFKFMADHAQDPFILIRDDGSFAYLNAKAAEAWGYAPDEVNSLRVQDVDPVYNEAAFKELFERAQKETILPFETLHRRKDGHIYPVEVNVNGIAIDGKNYLFAVSRDLSDRKKAEEELRISEDRFRTMVNTVPESIWITDAEGNNEFLNQHWLDYCGEEYSKTTANEMAIKYLHPDDAPKVMKAFAEAIKTGRPFDVEQRNRSKDGEYRWFLNRATPYRDPATGQITKWIGVGVDIHDRKLAEKALRKSEEDLEQKIEERTAELAQANEELKRSNRNLEEFAYAASHDLKEPVRKIHFFSDRLKERLKEKLEEEDIRDFSRMEMGAKRMSTLIDDLLTYSHVTRGIVSEETVDLDLTLAHVLDDLELHIEQKSAQIDSAPLPTIKGHPRQLQQLFENLVANALKYSSQHRRPVIQIVSRLIKGNETDLQLRGEEGNKDYHLIEVIDNGIGFDPADAERIFNVFTRLHGNAEYKGTGVGLSIARKVVQNHTGYIWAQSLPDEGSIFKILLPANHS